MITNKKLIECVPNFSEGRDKGKIEKIMDSFRGKNGVKLLDYSADESHNRLVVTIVGEMEPVKNAVIEAMGTAASIIDMTKHTGEHPRMGATDVIPFIPVRNVSMTEVIEFSKEVAKEAAERYNIPIFLYEKSATSPERENLATVRKGQFEGMAEKLQQPEWKPDFGSDKVHPTAGVTAIGARMPLVAFNVNLSTNNKEIAAQIAKNIRHLNGGLRFCKAIAIDLSDKGIAQVSMNMTDYTKTALYRAYELIKIEARRFGIHPIGSEIVGTIPMEALIDTAVYYLGVENFTMNQILETRLME
ncbi:glutamate formimidoyltransferase [Lutispora saccharofermentans]|uniref:glutamate formimidoyltransferase n=1 Tax=Lutispora saccharofermentans TaxID=3024236 RepID=A0ABT1NAT4_9FIRM|nr:glutamate formimidoyltransferase [Lutispora saccharofermentans]MCQ1528221.1 glutamate formimidoyltransferase [Lutispora saccharofermentans]